MNAIYVDNAKLTSFKGVIAKLRIMAALGLNNMGGCAGGGHVASGTDEIMKFDSGSPV